MLQDLARAGLIASRPGPGGGYELLKTPAELTILDVVSAVSPLERIRGFAARIESTQTVVPVRHAELDRAYAATEAAFAGVTMEALLVHQSQRSIV